MRCSGGAFCLGKAGLYDSNFENYKLTTRTLSQSDEFVGGAANKSTGAPAAMIVFAYQQMLHQIFKTPCPLGGLLRLSADNIKIIGTLTGGCAAGIFAVPQVDDDRVRGLLDRDHVRTFSVIVNVDDKRSQALFKMLNKSILNRVFAKLTVFPVALLLKINLRPIECPDQGAVEGVW